MGLRPSDQCQGDCSISFLVSLDAIKAECHKAYEEHKQIISQEGFGGQIVDAIAMGGHGPAAFSGADCDNIRDPSIQESGAEDLGALEGAEAAASVEAETAALLEKHGLPDEISVKIEGAELRARDVSLDRPVYLSELGEDGVVRMAIETRNAKDGWESAAHATDIFNLMMEVYGDGVKAIEGNWGEKMPSNLDEFNKNLRAGMSEEDAARNTFTGRRAAEHGFTRPERMDEGFKGSAPNYTKALWHFWR